MSRHCTGEPTPTILPNLHPGCSRARSCTLHPSGHVVDLLASDGEYTAGPMATIDHGAVPAHTDPQEDRPLRDVPATRLVERLERQFDRGEAYDDAVVFELATRAIDAEEGTAVATTF
jgi:hypothetical protein